MSSHRGEAAHWLIEPNEVRTLPEIQALLVADITAPRLVRVKQYYRIRHIARRANLPVRWQPPMKRLSPFLESDPGNLSPD